MNLKLIFQLSLFGLAMSLATISLIPPGIEPICWLAIFVICAYSIARQCSSRYFLHGLLLGIINSIWITAIHIAFYKGYLQAHPQEAGMMARMPWPDSPRLMMLITGPFVGLASGLILGLFAVIASKLTRKRLSNRARGPI